MDPFVDLIRRLRHHLTGGEVAWGAGLVVGATLVSIGLVLAVVVTWPADHFRPEGRRFMVGRHPLLRLVARVGKNLAGAIMLVGGLVMALPGVPGQGILTMIIGLTLMDFPGKEALERRLVSRPAVRKVVDGLRARFGRAPLEL